MEQQFYLAADIVGTYSQKLYGAKGDQVALVTDHGNVAIVRRYTDRFPVPTSLLLKSLEQLSENKMPITAKHDAAPAKRTKSKKPSLTTNKLF
jgi:hypothetical protein